MCVSALSPLRSLTPAHFPVKILPMHHTLLEIRYHKNVMKLKRVSSEDKGKQSKGKKCKQKIKNIKTKHKKNVQREQKRPPQSSNLHHGYPLGKKLGSLSKGVSE